MDLGKKISAEDLQRIEKAIEAGERNTSGEIIPFLIGRSTPVDAVPLKLTFLFFSLAPGLMYELHVYGIDWGWSLWGIVLGFLFASWILGKILSHSLWIQRILTAGPGQYQACQDRAELEFYRGRFHRTAKQTGILIFVSWMEHRVIVLADKGISAKLPQETWDGVVEIMVKQLRQGRVGDGFVDAINACAELLAKHFPSSGENQNEIPNKLIVREY